MRQCCLYLVCVLCAFGSQSAFCEETDEDCLNAAEPMAASVDPCYCKLPLTAELRICTEKSDSYNIFIATGRIASINPYIIVSIIKLHVYFAVFSSYFCFKLFSIIIN